MERSIASMLPVPPTYLYNALPMPVHVQGGRESPSKVGFETRFTPQVGELVTVEKIVVVVVVETVFVIVISMVEVVNSVLVISTELTTVLWSVTGTEVVTPKKEVEVIVATSVISIVVVAVSVVVREAVSVAVISAVWVTVWLDVISIVSVLV